MQHTHIHTHTQSLLVPWHTQDHNSKGQGPHSNLTPVRPTVLTTLWEDGLAELRTVSNKLNFREGCPRSCPGSSLLVPSIAQ